jgi:hypothetical protein
MDSRDKDIADGLARLSRTLERPDEKKVGHAGGTDTEEAVGSIVQGLPAGSPPDDSPPSGPGTPSVTLEPTFPDDGLLVVATMHQEITNFLVEADRANDDATVTYTPISGPPL